MGLLTPGWQKKALHLRTIVSCSCSPIAELDTNTRDYYDAMRAFNRGTIGPIELKARLDTIGPPDGKPRLYEPAQIHGWDFQAGICAIDGKVWWVVSVAWHKAHMPSDKDRAMLVRIMDALGCDDMERDRVSVSSFDDVIAAGIPFVYMWPNTGPLHEVQINPAAKTSRDPKKIMRVVPRGTRPTDGFERLPDDPPE